MRALLTVAVLALMAGCSASSDTGPTAASPPSRSTFHTPPRSPDSPTPSRSPRQPVDPALRQLGRLFLDFAERRRETPPADTPVDLLLGSRKITTLDPTMLRSRSAWRICVDAYAARTCPFSALDALAAYDGRVHMSTRPPDHPCMARLDTPYRGRWLTLTPTGNSDCTSWFAVVLQADDADQVTAVDLVIAEP